MMRGSLIIFRFIFIIFWLQEYGKAERLELAIKSRQEAPAFGSAERQQIIQDVHNLLLQRGMVCGLKERVS